MGHGAFYDESKQLIPPGLQQEQLPDLTKFCTPTSVLLRAGGGATVVNDYIGVIVMITCKRLCDRAGFAE